MKFGQLLETESVPEWSLHNIDYNTLKHFIKVHTTRDQASAITIPGQTDTALQRFEDDFYKELCRQHDRVGLFVATKADEISRRLQHLADQIHRLLLRSATGCRGTAALKRQRRFAKYERTALQLHGEIRDLSRFVHAQVVAFRKILKKHKKWTGSGALTTRFRDNVLSESKSFTRRDFTHLEVRCDELLATLRASTPLSNSPQTPREELLAAPAEFPDLHTRRLSNGQIGSSSSSTVQALSSSAGSTQAPPCPSTDRPRRVTLLATAPVQTHYWNEYDDGSEAGDVGGGPGGSGGYAIYVHPEEEEDFPGMATLVSFFTVPLEKAKKWMASRSGARVGGGGGGGDRGPLLSARDGCSNYGAATAATAAAVAAAAAAAATNTTAGGGLFDSLPGQEARRASGSRRHRRRRAAHGAHDAHDAHDADHDSTEEEEDDDDDDVFASDSDFPQGYATHYATLPSIADQRMARFRDTMLFRGTLGCYAAALVLLGVASILISTGKHKLRVEVDAGVILGVMASLGFACAALGMTMARHSVRLSGQVAVWAAFATVCALNGAVLVLVMGNTVIANQG